MKFSSPWVLMGFVALAGGCKSETQKQCFDGAETTKKRVSACGELCDKDDGKACAAQADIAIDSCMTKHDAEICNWMCLYAKVGKDVYCKEYTKLTGKPAE